MSKKNAKQLIIYFFLTGFFFAFTLFIYAPLEMYLGNINEFSFQLSMFWWMPVLTGIAATGLVVGVGLLINLVFKRSGAILYGASVFALGLACYIQGNFLGLRLGVLNGSPVAWEDYTMPILKDIFVWVAIIVIVLAFTHFLRGRTIRVLGIISVVLIAIQGVALTVSLASTDYTRSNEEAKRILSDKGLFEFSSKKNVVVFILDMFDDTYFKTLLEREPSFADKFTGFTHFTNSVGSASTTAYGIGTIFTGRYLLNGGSSYGDMVNRECAITDFYNDLLKNRVRLGMYSPSVPGVLYEKLYNYCEVDSTTAYIPDKTALLKNVYKLVLSKYAPDVLKPLVWIKGNEFANITKNSINRYSRNNSDFVPLLNTSAATMNNSEASVKFIHIEATHYPYTIDKNGGTVPESQSSDLIAAEGTLNITLEYFNKMKELGIYEDATIIICADHGYYWDGVLTNPVLLVKKSGDIGAMKSSNAPVCHLDLHATIMDDLGYNTDHKYGKSVFEIEPGETRNRKFYQYYLSESNHIDDRFRLIEYSVSDDSNLRKAFRLTDREITIDGNIIPHKENCEYCLSGAYDAEDPDTPNNVMLIHNQIKK